jgi:hypothetical protein
MFEVRSWIRKIHLIKNERRESANPGKAKHPVSPQRHRDHREVQAAVT